MNNENVRRATLAIALLTILSMTLKGQGLATPGGRTITIHESGSRCLPYAIERIADITGVPINYEGVPIENPADMEDLANTIIRNGSAAVIHRPIARGGVLNVTVYLSGVDAGADALSAVQAVLDAYRRAQLPGDYAVEQKGGRIYVFPTQTLSANGIERDVMPVMSTPITFPVADREVVDTLQLIADSISKKAGVRVILAGQPFSNDPRVTLGADAQPAREVLARLFEQYGELPYYALYNPEARVYYLNFIPVRTSQPRPPVQAPAQPRSSTQASANPWFSKKPTS